MIVYNDQGQILMGKRLSKYGFGTWNNPGGKVEFGEDPMNAAIRETEEETNLWVSRVKHLGYFNDEEIYDGITERHWVTMMFAGFCPRPSELRNLEPHKHSEWKWFHLNELPADMWEPMWQWWESDEMAEFHNMLYAQYGAKELARLE
jgi:8-oxo-dGTP diphosphatase